MKTYRHLFEHVVAPEALFDAFHRARRGKSQRPDCNHFFANLETEVFRLHDELIAGKWKPGPYHTFHVHDPKERLIAAAPFEDRVVHHAICAVLEPLVDRKLIHDTYACRPGKGHHRALDRFTHFARRFGYVMKLDVRRFFPSVDHEQLVRLLAQVFHDERLMTLITSIIESGTGLHPASEEPVWYPGDTLWTPLLRSRGLPIGNLTSQVFANLYLSPLDEFVKRTLRCRGYVRYMDDMAFFAPDRPQLEAWHRKVSGFLETWRLQLNEARTAIVPVEQGLAFLGFRVYPDHRRLLGKSVRRFARRLRQMGRAYAAGNLAPAAVSHRLASWVAHASQAIPGGYAANCWRRPHGDVRRQVSRQSRPRPRSLRCSL